MKKNKVSWIDLIPSTLATFLFISQMLLGLYLLSNISQIEILAYAGVVLYIFSGIFFGMIPTFEFRKKGDVKKG